MTVKYPGLPTVIHGNGAVAEVMGHVCGGVIGYPITPSTEISEIYEAFRAGGGVNVWGKHPFFFEPEGEHSAQSGALGAALTGGKYISNASSSQGILYGLESHYVTAGKKVGGFVLQVAARVVSKHSLNVMAGHDDVYALLSSGYTVLFGSNPQEAADLAAISYKVSALSLIPVANCMDGFATSHMLSEASMPEPELLREFVGDPEGRIKAPTVAQEMLFGAKGRVNQLGRYLERQRSQFDAASLQNLKNFLEQSADAVERDNEGALIAQTAAFVPEALRDAWRRQWLNAYEKGTRQRVPALVDPHNPGLTGGVQNQPDFQAGAADHRTHFAADVPHFVREAMAEYSALTGRAYSPVMTYSCEDAEMVMVGLGSVTDDVREVVKYLRGQGKKVGVVSIKLVQPFPEAELVAALAGKKAVTVLERSDATALTSFVNGALVKALENAGGVRHAGIPAISVLPKLTTAIFGLGAHDLQPRHLVAAFKNMEGRNAPFVYLGSQFFTKTQFPRITALQDRLKAAYPETEFMALETEQNPRLLPPSAFRIRFHSVGGYGTIATGKLLTDILAGVLEMRSKAAPKYGSEKSGAPTNYYITLSPEPVLITNAELEDVEIVISPDHKVFSHTNPLKGLVEGGSFILQTRLEPLEAWREMPQWARKTIREKNIRFFVVDGFAVAKRHAPTPDLETRMMGIAFIGALCGHVDRVKSGVSQEALLTKIRDQISYKFGAKGGAVVDGNMAVIREGLEATKAVDYSKPEFAAEESAVKVASSRGVAISAAASGANRAASCNGLFDRDYYDETVASAFKDGSIAEAPVLPGTGLFMPAATSAWKDKGLFRRDVPLFNAQDCTGCMECTLVCPDAAIPNAVHSIDELLHTAIGMLELDGSQREQIHGLVPQLSERVRDVYAKSKKDLKPFHEIVAGAASELVPDASPLREKIGGLIHQLAVYPVAKTKPFFNAFEKAGQGGGGLFAVNIDPWKCTGCLECVEVCGPGALIEQQQDDAMLEAMQARFEFFSRTPNTPERFLGDALHDDGETKRLMLDRKNYYATIGGHGACRGCGEVTAIRLVLGLNRGIQHSRRAGHIAETQDLIAKLKAKLTSLQNGGAQERGQRIARTIEALEKRLYLLESGPTGEGPTPAIIANATGCSSVYASTFPFNPYKDPWVNSLFQDSPALAKGIFEGLTAQFTGDVQALRTARLEAADAYDPKIHDAALKFLAWSDFTPEELSLLPTIFSIGGDGATYDIGFGALSRLLTTNTPVKVVVLNTGAYSNTGGQASTASLTGQDSDLSRFGKTHHGKQELRKELGMIAAVHPNVFVAQLSTGVRGHFLKSVMDYLRNTSSPGVIDVYTPCQPEHGIADNASHDQAQLAVESRMSPVFVHDPRRGKNFSERFSIEGNPGVDNDWGMQSIEHLDETGARKQLRVPLTPADFALREIRFKKHFKPLGKDDNAGVPLVEYIDMDAGAAEGKIPFVWSVDADKRLVKIAVGPGMVELVLDRRRNWRTLQYLSGRQVARLAAEHRNELEALQKRYQEEVRGHDASLDQIAQAMSELAASSGAPIATGLGALLTPFGGSTSAAAASAPAAAPAAGANGAGPIVTMDEDKAAACTNCKTCYQDASEIFEKTQIAVDGQTKEVAHMIPGALDKIKVTPELRAKLIKVAANCDAEIIHVH
jgi:pyruvate-ferredoxin/flavodoxin oxidoreductase